MEETISKALTDITIKFIKSNDHKTFTASGAWGGLNPQGEIVCHFYVESQSFPDKINFVEENGKLVENFQRNNLYNREIQHTLVIRPEIAHSIGSWLITKSKEYEKIAQEAKDKK
jgi:hypothetical protein